MKKFSIIIMLFIFLGVVPTISYATTDCSSKLYWDGVELKLGQIGRVIVQKPTNIYKNNNGTLEVVRQAKRGDNYRIYANKETYFHLGGGLVIKNDTSILYQTPSKEKLSKLLCAKSSPTTFTIGDDTSTVTVKLGAAKKSISNEFHASTSIYHKSYNNFYAISYVNNKIASIYTKDKDYQFNGISISSTVSQLESKLGKDYETTSNTYPIEVITYDLPNYQANFFIDVHNENKISAILLLDHQLIENNPNLYPKKSTALETSYETLLFELTNAERKAKGVPVLQHASNVSTVARKHSADMGTNDYFNHDNLKGETPFDRLSNGGVLFRNAGENIAMGYTNPYFAHEALMNSLGHRTNIVSTNYTQIGVGVYFAKWTYGSIPYYTENFIKP
ncbi:CAP domain-containing protein [Psychrobacillus vulpis]|uniref:Serine protease n=1 Tax=Psychrobacillus vulpis TaxID=2325572 RepID=A0A544TV97_9BACI|nr:CAP domain-containing protein [Psychrobacillus vulpis]TQR21372.1 hypothetical protein FG384_03980 [Psychrobacillus vulpis]